MAKLEIELVPCLKDNYAYLAYDRAQGVCAVVDASEPEPVKRALTERNLKLTHILSTHHHMDHVGGNSALKQAYGVKVVGAAKDAARIPGIDIGLNEGETFSLGSHVARVLEIPAHTSQHIAFWFDADRAVFTGDTLFAMGCGRLFEGTPEMMWASLSKLMKLPDDARIYCGHEYTEANGRFALTVEPENPDLKRRMDEVRARRRTRSCARSRATSAAISAWKTRAMSMSSPRPVGARTNSSPAARPRPRRRCRCCLPLARCPSRPRPQRRPWSIGPCPSRSPWSVPRRSRTGSPRRRTAQSQTCNAWRVPRGRADCRPEPRASQAAATNVIRMNVTFRISGA
jgi:hydroxyacylglutathione hydrolase